MDWKAAIMYRDHWKDLYSSSTSIDEGLTFVEFVQSWNEYFSHSSAYVETRLIVEAMLMFDSMPEEEQIQVVLMGW